MLDNLPKGINVFDVGSETWINYAKGDDFILSASGGVVSIYAGNRRIGMHSRWSTVVVTD